MTPLAVMFSLPNPPLKGDQVEEPYHSFLTMATSHLHLFQPSVANETEIRKLVVSHPLPDREVLQWCPTAGEDIPTPKTNKIVVFASFFQRWFGLPVCDFLCGLLDHYQIETVHLNPNSILHITILSTSVKPFLGFLRIFLCSKNISS
jgi:hypothetical protein